MRLNIAAGILTSIAALVGTQQAHANAILELVSGTSTSAASVGGIAALSSVSINGWTVSFAQGTSYPATGSTVTPLDDLASVNITKTGNAPLLIEFSAAGFVSGTPAAAVATMSGAALSGTLAGTYKTYYDSSDTLLALTTLLTSQSFTASSLSGTAFGVVSGATPFSLTQVIQINTGLGSLDDSLAVPDGGTTLIMLGGAMTALTLVRAKIRKA